MLLSLLVVSLCGLVLADVTDKDVALCRVESCGGWALNRLPEVKKFIYDDLPLFHNCDLKIVGGAKPEFFLINKHNEMIEKFPLSDLSREECNNLVKSKGFFKKENKNDDVPEEYKNGPYVAIPHEDL